MEAIIAKKKAQKKRREQEREQERIELLQNEVQERQQETCQKGVAEMLYNKHEQVAAILRKQQEAMAAATALKHEDKNSAT